MRMLWLVVLASCGRFELGEIDADGTDAVVDAYELPPCTGTALFSDTFDDAAPEPIFRTTGSGSGLTVSESNGAVHITFAAAVPANSYRGYRTLATYAASSICVTFDTSKVSRARRASRR